MYIVALPSLFFPIKAPSEFLTPSLFLLLSLSRSLSFLIITTSKSSLFIPFNFPSLCSIISEAFRVSPIIFSVSISSAVYSLPIKSKFSCKSFKFSCSALSCVVSLNLLLPILSRFLFVLSKFLAYSIALCLLSFQKKQLNHLFFYLFVLLSYLALLVVPSFR